MNADVLTHQLVEPGAHFADLHLLNQARVLFGIQLIRRFGLFIGGASDNPNITDKEAGMLSLEAFLSLCGEPKSQQRMQHMLMNNKPLRN